MSTSLNFQPSDPLDREYFYLHLRHSKEDPTETIVVCASKSIKGPFYKFRREHRDRKFHGLFANQIQAASFEYFKNLKVCVTGDQRSKYFNPNGDFFFNGELLFETVNNVDEIFSSE